MKQKSIIQYLRYLKAAAFGRLCVETPCFAFDAKTFSAAAFGRLCVETHIPIISRPHWFRSRLRAAVC